MNLLKFYVTIIDDKAALQIIREDDIKMNVYQKRVVCDLDEVMTHVNDLTGDWRLYMQYSTIAT